MGANTARALFDEPARPVGIDDGGDVLRRVDGFGGEQAPLHRLDAGRGVGLVYANDMEGEGLGDRGGGLVGPEHGDGRGAHQEASGTGSASWMLGRLAGRVALAFDACRETHLALESDRCTLQDFAQVRAVALARHGSVEL